MRAIAAAAIVIVSLGVCPAADAPGPGPRLESATFAAGCFWGVEAAFAKVPGVVKTVAGYTGGRTANPTYRDVYAGHTGHVEAVLVIFDPAKVRYAQLLDVFWSCHDPTADLRSGDDEAPHYSAIFFHDAGQEAVARASLGEIERDHVFARPVATRVEAAKVFYPAEAIHQHYFQRQGIGGSCHWGHIQVHTRLASAGVNRKQVIRLLRQHH